MSTETSDHQVSSPSGGVNHITTEAPWQWLSQGWKDIWTRPMLSLGYGLVMAVAGWLLFAGLFNFHMAALVLMVAGGFMLLSPLLAVGLYEKSRRLEVGEPLATKDIVFVATKSPVQLGLLGVLLCLAFLAWIRIATLLFALFFGPQPFPPLDAFLPTLMFTWHGLGLLIVGSLFGGAIAFVVFTISAISVPMLMAEDSDAPAAVVTSTRAVLQNLKPMLLWAWLIAILTAVGLVTGFLGLIVTFPLIGHGTWHAYRSLRAA